MVINNIETNSDDYKIDNDWLKYLNCDNNDDDNNEVDDEVDNDNDNINDDINDNINDNINDDINDNNYNINDNNISNCNNKNIENNKVNNLSKNDLFSDIYISTKTKIGYLDQEINIYDVFWNINLLNYHELKEGFVKKQIKLSFYNKQEVEECNNKLKNYSYYNSKQLIDIDNPNGRIKFKNIKILLSTLIIFINNI